MKKETYSTHAVIVECKKCKAKNYWAGIEFETGGGLAPLTCYCYKCKTKLTDKTMTVIDNSPRVKHKRIKPTPTMPLFDVNDEKAYMSGK